jgi:hypothetical protein
LEKKAERSASEGKRAQKHIFVLSLSYAFESFSYFVYEFYCGIVINLENIFQKTSGGREKGKFEEFFFMNEEKTLQPKAFRMNKLKVFAREPQSFYYHHTASYRRSFHNTFHE